MHSIIKFVWRLASVVNDYKVLKEQCRVAINADMTQNINTIYKTHDYSVSCSQIKCYLQKSHIESHRYFKNIMLATFKILWWPHPSSTYGLGRVAFALVKKMKSFFSNHLYTSLSSWKFYLTKTFCCEIACNIPLRIHQWIVSYFPGTCGYFWWYLIYVCDTIAVTIS